MATIAREQVIDLIADLPNESLEELTRFIEFLRFRSAQRPNVPPPDAEAPLAAIIARRLPPPDQRRLDELRALQEERSLTNSEHDELLSYIDRVEREDAERAQALLDLARLRNVPLNVLMADLGLASNG
jgi:sugar phosphate isomerase/epimerase